MTDAGTGKSPTDCGCGCKGDCNGDNVAEVSTTGARSRKPQRSVKRRTTVQASAANNSRVTALARRQAMSARGKAGVSANGMTAAQTVRVANPLISGRELAQALRTQRSRQGKTGQKKSSPCGRIRPPKNASVGAAQDAPWKVGAGETSQGQMVTGTMVGRSHKTTGDEPSTCRDVTGTEYMGADIFRDFCQSEPNKMSPKVGLSATLRGNAVTGNELGRSHHVTGDEPGSCQQVTGVEYLGAGHAETFCGARSESAPTPAPAKVARAETRKGKSVTGNKVGRSSKVTGDESGAGRELTGSQYMQTGEDQMPAKVPTKVGLTNTLRGGSVTGTMVGRSERVTGDEPGSCRIISGDDYVGGEQYRDFCASTPAPQDAKVGASQTFNGKVVTGTMTGRSGKVTGDEPGTCKAITGTGYAGAEQYYDYCKPEASAIAAARTSVQRGTAGAVMTGQQPGIGGKMTGTEKGSCESLTGTPYIGADQYAGACAATAAEPASPDFPQSLSSEDAPWGQFSIANMAAQTAQDNQGGVTGTRYAQGQITGPFGMATGKVTGTEDFRSARATQGAVRAESPRAVPETVASVEGRVKSRISGEGNGSKITGNDWDTGDLVTGTEGRSAMRRNPTRRGSAIAPTPPRKRNESLSEPVNKVTGSSGSTEKGSLVTYSGGARG